MVHSQLYDREWKNVELALDVQRGRGRRGRNDRNFEEAVLTGDVPECDIGTIDGSVASLRASARARGGAGEAAIRDKP